MHNSDIVGSVLHAFEIFGRNLEDYLHLVIPAMVGNTRGGADML